VFLYGPWLALVMIRVTGVFIMPLVCIVTDIIGNSIICIVRFAL
jgi:hypothetical protein